MNLTQEEADRAKELILQGASRFKLETELGLSEKDAYKVAIRVRVDEELEQRPELLDDIKFLLGEGESCFQIKKQTGLPLEAVEYLITKAQLSIQDEEVALDPEPAAAKAALREENEKDKEQVFLRVKRLMSSGYGAYRIRRELNLEADTVDALMEEVRSASFIKPKMFSKTEKVDIVHQVSGGGAFQVARAMEIAPGSAQKLIKRVQGKVSIADDSFKMAVSRGTTVMTLQNRFGFRSKEQVMEALYENFPEHFVYQKPKDDGDVGILVIPDKTNTYDFLKRNQQPKLFRTSVSEENNMMFVQMLPEFQGDHIKLYNLTDVHVGHKKFMREKFQEHVQMIAEDPCAFALWGGDMFEWAHKMSVGDPWEQVLSPMEQVPETGRLLAPIAHKTLAYRCGNHDKGRGKLVGADLAEALANMLGVPYFKVEVLIHIDFTPARLFRILLDHGHSGGAIASILRDTNKFTEYSAFPVHAHFSGHVHNSLRKAYIFKEPNLATMKFEFGRTHTIVGGSYLGYTGTYAEEAKFSPTSQDLGYLLMNRDGTYKAGEIEINPI